MSVLITLAVSFLLTVLLGRILIPVLHALKAGQSIREIGPKWHSVKAGTPTMGGIMFMVPALLCVAVAGWTAAAAGTWEHLMVLGFSLIYGAIGFVDDFVKVRMKRNLGLTARQKLVLQLVAALAYLALLRWNGNLTNELYIPFFQLSWEIPWVVYLAFAVLVIVGCVNAVNLTDGVDGLATGVTLPVMVFFAVAAWLWGNETLALFPAALVGGLAGFLWRLVP